MAKPITAIRINRDNKITGKTQGTNKIPKEINGPPNLKIPF